MCGDDDTDWHGIIYCKETKVWREQIWQQKWNSFKEEGEVLIIRKILSVKGENNVRNIGEYLGKVREKWLRTMKNN